ncbi:DUF2157 domain-containing protein [Acinetobacter sp. YH12251]|uniref:DUF2157 domain-containing protein n=1 Tax=Acinetobacter sp. YH12251 TaxID=2601176 RepID=UPI0015D1CAC6|nr:DUF2157 domain-containing protein [Acinetobacter sp. YH12251]
MTAPQPSQQQNIKLHCSQLDQEFSTDLFQDVQVIRYLQVIGVALIAASFVYLIAANWLMLPKFIQLAIPKLLLLLSAVTSVYFARHAWIQQSLDTLSGLLLGLSLAVIGQVYQTGADSYLLFLVWALLLLPWLYRPNIGVFALLCLISQLALFLYFKQSYLIVDHSWWYLLCMNILTAICVTLCLKYYAALRFVFVAFITLMSMYCMFLYCGNGVDQYQWQYLIFALLLPIYLIIYFYRQQRALETSLQTAGLAASFSILIFQWAEHILSDSSAGLLVFALLIFAWFAVISWALMKFLPQTKFAVIPLAIGAWLAGIILSSLLLTYWKAFSIVMGLVFVAVAWWLIRRAKSIFSRQFAYCLWVCGQSAVFIHTESLTNSISFILVLQIGVILLCLFSRMHWFIVFIQLIAGYGLAVATLFDADLFMSNEHVILAVIGLNYILLIFLLGSATAWLHSMYRKSIVLWMLCIVLAGVVLQTLSNNILQFEQTQNGVLDLFVGYLLPVVWLGLYIANQKKQAGSEKWPLLLLGLVLIAMGYFGIFLLLVLLAWAQVYQQSLVKALSIVLIIFSLWMLYYNLGLSFLLKSLTILISGLLLLGITKMLSTIQYKQGGDV